MADLEREYEWVLRSVSTVWTAGRLPRAWGLREEGCHQAAPPARSFRTTFKDPFIDFLILPSRSSHSIRGISFDFTTTSK